MITPNAKAHMSPKDLVIQIASEVETVQGWSLNDPAFFAAFDYPVKISLIRQIHVAIKEHHFSIGGTLEQWQTISNSPAKFNQLWRHALGIALDTTPPPISFRNKVPLPFDLDLPFQTSI